MRYIYDLKDIPEERIRMAGGKARSLNFMMTSAKLAVPGGSVILADGIECGALKHDAQKELDDLIASLDRKVTYAVRSSAVNEDGNKASFAGQYETVTDVKADEIREAVKKVAGSASNERVREYGSTFEQADGGIAVVIQRFVKPQFAGVIFTSDIMTARDDRITGNYVRGEGEQLVSGSSNAEVFTIDAIGKGYEGASELKPYAGALRKASLAIRNLYRMPMDIEWAVSGRKLYILQARPITTLRRLNMDTYDINGTRSGYKMLTRTNVGEIFMKPVSPATFSVLEKINDILGLPDWLDNICGQAYMNISVMCSIQVAFGTGRAKAYERIRSLAGNVPDGVEVPVSPFDKKAFRRRIKTLLFPKEKSKLSRKEKREMVRDLPDITRRMVDRIRAIGDNRTLLDYWDNEMLPKLKDGFASILAECGLKMVPLFSTRGKIAKIAGDQMADRLCGGCLGVVESMKPMLLIEDVIEGRMTREEYVKQCGHRCPDEMELMAPRPYEDPGFPDNVIGSLQGANMDLHAMLECQQKEYEEALEEFGKQHPSKRRSVARRIAKFAEANAFREDIRSKGVLIFCTFREFILAMGRINGLGDDVFMFTFDEIFECLRGKPIDRELLKARRATYEEYLKYPPFPNIVVGRFDPDKWAEDPDRHNDYFVEDMKREVSGDADIKGFPGARGVVTGRAVVITDVSRIDEAGKGDILVTTATNIGWTVVFPRVAAIVTDIGAPLSHAAIVAREFGIPAVVGCGNATTVIRTGDIITVDGAAGTVVIGQITHL